MIRFTKDYNKEIRRIVQNYNRRVNRATKLNLPAPSKVKVRDIKAIYYNRKDLNQRLKELELFNVKSARETNDRGETLYQANLNNLRYKRAVRELKSKIAYAKRQENRAINYIDSNRYAYEQTLKKLQRLQQAYREGRALSSSDERDRVNIITTEALQPEKTARLRDNILKMLNTYASWMGIPYNDLKNALDKVANLNLGRLEALSKYSNMFKNWLNNYHIQSDIEEGIFEEEYIDQPYASGSDVAEALLRSLADEPLEIGFA